MKIYRFFAIFAIALLMVVSTGQSGYSDPWDLEELTLWPGYGDVWNRYTYTQVYYEGDPGNDNDDAVYFGTYNQRAPAAGVSYGLYDEVNNIEYGSGIAFGSSPVSKGGRIWKYHVSSGQWSLVWPNVEDLSEFDPDEFGWRIAAVYDPPGDGPGLGAKVYFGSYKSGFNSGARLMEIDPADDSVKFIAGPGNWGSLVSVRALAVYNDKLYIGSERYFGGALWSYGLKNPPAPAGENPFELVHVWDRPSGYNVAYLEAYDGYLYIGGWYSAALYRMGTDEIPSGNIIPSEVAGESGGPISMEVFQGKLFVGTADLGGNGFSLFYYDSWDDSDPTILTTTGYGGHTYAWILQECGDLLFMGAFTSGGDPEEGLWATSNGDDWTSLPDFYNPTPTEYGTRSMSCGIPADGVERLYYGTAADNDGSSDLRFDGATRIFRIEGPFDALPSPPAPE